MGKISRSMIVYENSLHHSNQVIVVQPYRIIHHTNLILKYVPDIKFQIEDDKIDLAEITMRAFCYFVIAKT